MFLHSGASLHGHEYSNRPIPQPGHVQRRNPLLRSAFATPINRTSTYRTSSEISPNEPNLPKLQQIRPRSEIIPKGRDPVVKFQEPRCNSTTAEPEAMSEDEGSIASDSGASGGSFSARRTRRRAPRKSTGFVLAHPPPKLRTKQRLIHIRPQLLLQVQQLSATKRPRPAIDVYPSSAIARSLIAPLLKRFPRIARIKRELGIQDVMLVKSEDYSSQASGSESDGDEDGLKSRELLAILSPLVTEDKAEIVLADGTVWVATPKFNGTTLSSYEFISADSNGSITTARWVRKQITSKSLPPTPISPSPPPLVSSAADSKFTFSIIDPNCRRHPIMATLTNSSLDILDTYTTVSQSASLYPPTSPLLSNPTSPTSKEHPLERTTQQVEDWQKTFIAVSAVWVVLRHGWSPNCKPADFIPSNIPVSASPSDATTAARNRSLSVNSETRSKGSIHEPICHRKSSAVSRMGDRNITDILPRRATSTGAAFMQKLNSTQPGGIDQTAQQGLKKSKRTFSGDWEINIANRNKEFSLTAVLDPSSKSPTNDLFSQSNSSSAAQSPLSTGRRALSTYYSVDPLPIKIGEGELTESPDVIQRESYFPDTRQEAQVEDQTRKVKHQKWRNMANWFRKLQGR
ncbi:uncharacterized protein GGS25DRAFT_237300 [Hypoxylon fragiforme]|uniref:uncharacterized protein n=1 Tax=Hypoxylon fragiforme TaxID=63214 RepID=UPI0020C654E5|nr:uncharacterized protein GGS25DRAFT_237300 [Hypoxylon fragiforme]KAI2609868.1 hypothetical protein GGS25DRAFT_237300 [Hypoxylon fragiforme]